MEKLRSVPVFMYFCTHKNISVISESLNKREECVYDESLLLTLALLASSLVSAQVIVYKYEQFNADSVRRELDKRPYFSLNKDNYLIVGTTLGERPTSSNTEQNFS
jgi:hypothetical protein